MSVTARLLLFTVICGITAALFVFLSASAGTGIVGAGGGFFAYRSALFASVGGAAFACDLSGLLSLCVLLASDADSEHLTDGVLTD